MGLTHTLLIAHLLMVAVYVCVCYQVVFEVAFNSARGGYVAIDDISFSPEFCHTDTGERGRLDFRGESWTTNKDCSGSPSWFCLADCDSKYADSKSEVSLVATRGCNVNCTSQCKSV